jgi:hypothetical protein
MPSARWADISASFSTATVAIRIGKGRRRWPKPVTVHVQDFGLKLTLHERLAQCLSSARLKG